MSQNRNQRSTPIGSHISCLPISTLIIVWIRKTTLSLNTFKFIYLHINMLNVVRLNAISMSGKPVGSQDQDNI